MEKSTNKKRPHGRNNYAIYGNTVPIVEAKKGKKVGTGGPVSGGIKNLGIVNTAKKKKYENAKRFGLETYNRAAKINNGAEKLNNYIKGAIAIKEREASKK